jgi:hypothetical protein
MTCFSWPLRTLSTCAPEITENDGRVSTFGIGTLYFIGQINARRDPQYRLAPDPHLSRAGSIQRTELSFAHADDLKVTAG